MEGKEAANASFLRARTAILSRDEATSTLRKRCVPIEWLEKRCDQLLND